MLVKIFLPQDEDITPEDVLRLTLFSVSSDELKNEQLKETFKLFRKYRHAFNGTGYYDWNESNPIYVAFELKPLELKCFTSDIRHLNLTGSTY